MGGCWRGRPLVLAVLLLVGISSLRLPLDFQNSERDMGVSSVPRDPIFIDGVAPAVFASRSAMEQDRPQNTAIGVEPAAEYLNLYVELPGGPDIAEGSEAAIEVLVTNETDVPVAGAQIAMALTPSGAYVNPSSFATSESGRGSSVFVAPFVQGNVTYTVSINAQSNGRGTFAVVVITVRDVLNLDVDIDPRNVFPETELGRVRIRVTGSEIQPLAGALVELRSTPNATLTPFSFVTGLEEFHFVDFRAPPIDENTTFSITVIASYNGTALTVTRSVFLVDVPPAPQTGLGIGLYLAIGVIAGATAVVGTAVLLLVRRRRK